MNCSGVLNVIETCPAWLGSRDSNTSMKRSGDQFLISKYFYNVTTPKVFREMSPGVRKRLICQRKPGIKFARLDDFFFSPLILVSVLSVSCTRQADCQVVELEEPSSRSGMGERIFSLQELPARSASQHLYGNHRECSSTTSHTTIMRT